MDNIPDIISKVMNSFIEQELGNKITQFNIQGLITVLLSEIDKIEKSIIEFDNN